jgi:hypothetical protein
MPLAPRKVEHVKHAKLEKIKERADIVVSPLVV